MKNRMRPLLRTALALLFLGSLAAPARADWLFTPFLGIAFGGASNQFVLGNRDDQFEQRVVFGGSVGYRFNGIVGVELDYGLAPNFFQFTGGKKNFDLLSLDSSAQTVLGNVVISLPMGGSRGAGVQPYVTAGFGTVRTRIRSASDVFDDIVSDDSVFNVGAGANVFVSRHIGMRADVRYIRGFESLDDEDPITDNPFFEQAIATDVFNFYRGSVGLTFRW